MSLDPDPPAVFDVAPDVYTHKLAGTAAGLNEHFNHHPREFGQVQITLSSLPEESAKGKADMLHFLAMLFARDQLPDPNSKDSRKKAFYDICLPMRRGTRLYNLQSGLKRSFSGAKKLHIRFDPVEAVNVSLSTPVDSATVLGADYVRTRYYLQEAVKILETCLAPNNRFPALAELHMSGLQLEEDLTKCFMPLETHWHDDEITDNLNALMDNLAPRVVSCKIFKHGWSEAGFIGKLRQPEGIDTATEELAPALHEDSNLQVEGKDGLALEWTRSTGSGLLHRVLSKSPKYTATASQNTFEKEDDH